MRQYVHGRNSETSLGISSRPTIACTRQAARGCANRQVSQRLAGELGRRAASILRVFEVASLEVSVRGEKEMN